MRGPVPLTFPVTTLFMLIVFLSLGDFFAFFVSFCGLLFLSIVSWLLQAGFFLLNSFSSGASFALFHRFFPTPSF